MECFAVCCALRARHGFIDASCSYMEVMLPEYFGVSHMNVINATHATFNFINSHSGEIVDHFPITRNRNN